MDSVFFFPHTIGQPFLRYHCRWTHGTVRSCAIGEPPVGGGRMWLVVIVFKHSPRPKGLPFLYALVRQAHLSPRAGSDEFHRLLGVRWHQVEVLVFTFLPYRCKRLI